MSADAQLWNAVERLLAREALSLDDKDWDTWLSLYDEQAEYWIPAWADDGSYTRDPNNEISLVYYGTRAGLEDRVRRVQGGMSSAANLETRTCHSFTLLSVERSDDGKLLVRSNWHVHTYLAKQVRVAFGTALYHIDASTDAWKIASKKTLLLNDIADTVIDFYMI